MKKNRVSVISVTLLSVISLLFAVGCSSHSGGAAAVLPGAAGQAGKNTPFVSTAPSAPVQSAVSSAFVGSWVHTYEYMGNTYRTTLVIKSDGSAVYYNEETELGNFSAVWQYSGSGITLQRSDGVNSAAVIQNGVLTEQTFENGETYVAEYNRAS